MINSTEGGTSARYRVARLKRDHPAIAERLAAGVQQPKPALCSPHSYFSGARGISDRVVCIATNYALPRPINSNEAGRILLYGR